MPKIFQKDCKIKVIEYGEHCSQGLSLSAMVRKMVGVFTSLKKA